MVSDNCVVMGPEKEGVEEEEREREISKQAAMEGEREEREREREISKQAAMEGEREEEREREGGK